MTPDSSSPKARRRAIVAAMHDGDVTAAELGERFGVSLSTIRRDLQRLEAEGKIARTYGGITSPRSMIELPATAKDKRFQTEKDAIAQRAAEYVAPDDVCILDAGTTVGRLAVHLAGVHPLTVVTPGINALMALHDDENIELVLVGGRLRHVNQGLLGPLAEQVFDQITGDKVFLGAEGIDPVRGINCPTMDQARLKRLMAEAAPKVFILADASKLGRHGFPYWTKLPLGARLITTHASEEFVAQFEGSGGVVEQVPRSEVGDLAATRERR